MRRIAGRSLVLMLVVSIASFAAVAHMSPIASAKDTPGIYDGEGWGGMGVYNGEYDPTNPANHDTSHGATINCWCAADLEVNGDVGHPVFVSGPVARCVDYNGARTSWYRNGDVKILTGKLPPGLTIDDRGNIRGIPTDRANYIVNLLYGDSLQCGFQNFAPFEQQIRFYIKGTGEVIQ